MFRISTGKRLSNLCHIEISLVLPYVQPDALGSPQLLMPFLLKINLNIDIVIKLHKVGKYLSDLSL